jgi:hypothetical protein
MTTAVVIAVLCGPFCWPCTTTASQVCWSLLATDATCSMYCSLMWSVVTALGGHCWAMLGTGGLSGGQQSDHAMIQSRWQREMATTRVIVVVTTGPAGHWPLVMHNAINQINHDCGVLMTHTLVRVVEWHHAPEGPISQGRQCTQWSQASCWRRAATRQSSHSTRLTSASCSCLEQCRQVAAHSHFHRLHHTVFPPQQT